MKVVVDIMGGDYSPEEIVKGCVEALSERSDFSLVMTGDKNKIEELLLNYTVKPDRIEIVDAQEIITNDEVPTVAVKTKKNSSLVVACERVKEDDECIGMVSAGSTGAVLTAATLKIGRIKGYNEACPRSRAPHSSRRKRGLVRLRRQCGLQTEYAFAVCTDGERVFAGCFRGQCAKGRFAVQRYGR